MKLITQHQASTGRRAILSAVGHPLGNTGEGAVLDLAEDDIITAAFALYGTSAEVVDAAYFDEAGQRVHSPKRWLTAAFAWADGLSDGELADYAQQLVADGIGLPLAAA